MRPLNLRKQERIPFEKGRNMLLLLFRATGMPAAIEKKQSSLAKYPIYIITFATYWFGSLLSGNPIKRESGANPEQSRCCKFHTTL